MPQRISPSKLAAEFVVIFVSVILALLADDWRANRLLLAEERNVLEGMMRDLAEDETDLNRLAGRLEGFEENAQFAVAGMLDGEDFDEATWLPAFQGATGHFLYRPVYPTYTGLRQSGRLSLIRDEALREWIVEYHGDLIGYLVELRDSYDERHEAVLETMVPYFVIRFDQEDARWRSQLVAPVTELAHNQAVQFRLGQYARSVAWLHQRIDELFVPHNQRLREAIQAYLDGEPLPARIPRE